MALVACLCALLVFACIPVHQPHAYGATSITEGEVSALQQQVEESAAAYNTALEEEARLEEQIAAAEGRIAELQAVIPGQRDRAGQAMVSLYKMQNDTSAILQWLLGTTSINEFVNAMSYMSYIQDYYGGQITSLQGMLDELQATRDTLVSSREEAVAQRAAAYAALTQAQQLRQELQAQYSAQRQAEEEAARQAQEAASQTQEAASAQPAVTPEPEGGDSSTTETASQPSAEPTAIEGPADDGADWSSDKASFINAWAPRINAYLSGSPLGGYGVQFAAAAWDYGVDPRWSPAISCMESSKGLYCFLPHNAWGWGDCEWDTWDEAINDHVRGLGRIYGYTITVEGAKMYCPPNWEYWYTFVSAEMDKI